MFDFSSSLYCPTHTQFYLNLMKYTYFRDRAKKVHPSFLEETTTTYALRRLDPNIHMRDGAFHYDHSVHVLDETPRCELAALAKNGMQGRGLAARSTARRSSPRRWRKRSNATVAPRCDELAATVRCFM